MKDLENRVVWITGASSGIGEALAYQFAGRGARLILSARRDEELLRVKANCDKKATVDILPMDLSKTDELPAKVRWVLDKTGSIDILVNCAGVAQRSYAIDTSIDVFRRIMEINFFGTVQLSLEVLKHFLAKNAGLFIAISSVTGVAGLPKRTAYSASKHAVEGFFSALRTEIWRTGIRILVVRPGAVKTKVAENALTGDGSAFSQKDPTIENGITPEACACAIVSAVMAGKKELAVGSAMEKLLFILNRFVPRFVFNKIKKLEDR